MSRKKDSKSKIIYQKQKIAPRVKKTIVYVIVAALLFACTLLMRYGRKLR